jgi:hypothetical protein
MMKISFGAKKPQSCVDAMTLFVDGVTSEGNECNGSRGRALFAAPGRVIVDEGEEAREISISK